MTNPDPLVLYGQTFHSRLLLGTARYPSPDLLEAAVKRAKPAMLTASLRRQTANQGPQGSAGTDTSHGFMIAPALLDAAMELLVHGHSTLAHGFCMDSPTSDDA